MFGLTGTEPMELEGWLYVFPMDSSHQCVVFRVISHCDLQSLPFPEAPPAADKPEADRPAGGGGAVSCCHPDTGILICTPEQFWKETLSKSVASSKL